MSWRAMCMEESAELDMGKASFCTNSFEMKPGSLAPGLGHMTGKNWTI